MHFGSALPSTKVGDIIKQLDIKFQMMASIEDKEAEADFRNIKLKPEEPLEVFLQRYRTVFKKAWDAGHRPSSDIADQLVAKIFSRYLKAGEHHAKLVAKQQKEGIALGRKMNWIERHIFVLDFFDLAAASLIALRHARETMLGIDGGKKANAAEVNATKDRPKRTRSRGRGKKTFTTTTTNGANTGDSDSPIKKKIKTEVKKEATDPSPAAVNVTVNFGQKGQKGKKGDGKSKGKNGKGKKGKGKGKGAKGGKKGGGFDWTKPNPIAPQSWKKENGDWQCTNKQCGWFNWARFDKCQWCQSQKPK
jgi:hypothetical protein